MDSIHYYEHFLFSGLVFSKITIYLTISSQYLIDRKRNLLFMKTVNSGSYNARVMGPYFIIREMEYNAYLLDLPNDMDISPVFNVEDLLPYRDTFEPSTLPSSMSAGEVSKSAPTMPSL